MALSTARSFAEERQAAREEILEVTTSLIAEFAGQLPAGLVIGCVARARERLLISGVRVGLAQAAESSARDRLSALLSAHQRWLTQARLRWEATQ